MSREPYDEDLAQAQALVLHSKAYAHARHWLLHAPDGADLAACLRRLLDSWLGATLPARQPEQRMQPVQLGLGFTFAGLQRLALPSRVLNLLRERAPAFAAGAAVRAAALNDHGQDAAEFWDAGFAHQRLHAVLSLQARTPADLARATRRVERLLALHGLQTPSLPAGAWLAPARGAPVGNWVHFGYRDALAKMHVRDWPTRPDDPARTQHAAGEFLLGHAQDSGANPWALSTQPQPLRDFFRNGAFCALRQIEQDEVGFRQFLDQSAARLAAHLDGLGRRSPLAPAQRHARLRGFVQAKLMGRWPNGQAVSATHHPEDAPPQGPVSDAFSHAGDTAGQGCPFGSHIRRMNPRAGETSLAHSRRARVLLRRGMPYGPAYQEGESPARERGLMGLFFCASLEDQFEHIVGHWGAGIAMGSPDTGNANDPFVSAQPARARFVVPLPGGDCVLPVGASFVRTRGTAYLFHPSVPALRQLVQNGPWAD